MAKKTLNFTTTPSKEAASDKAIGMFSLTDCNVESKLKRLNKLGPILHSMFYQWIQVVSIHGCFLHIFLKHDATGWGDGRCFSCRTSSTNAQRVD